MTNALIVLGSLGGIVAFCTAVIVLAKGIFQQIQATKENTKATQDLSSDMINLTTKVNQHDQDLAILMDRKARQ